MTGAQVSRFRGIRAGDGVSSRFCVGSEAAPGFVGLDALEGCSKPGKRSDSERSKSKQFFVLLFLSPMVF